MLNGKLIYAFICETFEFGPKHCQNWLLHKARSSQDKVTPTTTVFGPPFFVTSIAQTISVLTFTIRMLAIRFHNERLLFFALEK